jgi:hypothetical protein
MRLEYCLSASWVKPRTRYLSGNQSQCVLSPPPPSPGYYSPRMSEHDFDYQGWIEDQADRRVPEDARSALTGRSKPASPTPGW